MEMVKLPKEVAEALESLRLPRNGFSNYAIIGMLYSPSKYADITEIKVLDRYMGQGDGKMHPDDLIVAMVNGYKVELTPEEKAIQWCIKRDCIARGHSAHDVVMAIKSILEGGE